MASERPVHGMVEYLSPPLESSLLGVEMVRVAVKVGETSCYYAVAFGSVTDAQTTAIMYPTSGDFSKIVMGGPSQAIWDACGFDVRDTKQLQELAKLSIPGYTSEGRNTPVGFSLACGSGKLISRGVEHIIFTNVVPRDTRGISHVSMCVASALFEANRVEVKSLAIPVFETHVLKLSYVDFMEGGLRGVARFIRELEGKEPVVNNLVQVLYFEPNQEVATGVGEALGEITDRLNSEAGV